MTKKLITALLLMLFATLGFSDETKTIKAVLKDVTVFFRGAELTHTASAELTKGENEIIIENISPVINSNSLQIKISNGVIVSSFEYSIDYLTDKLQNTVTQKIKDSIDFYNDNLITITTETRINNDMLAFLKQGVTHNITVAEKSLAVEELNKNIDVFQKKALEYTTAIAKLEKEKAVIGEKINRLKNQLAQEEIKHGKNSGILKLKLSSPLAVKAQLTIKYFTASAKWTPFYDINITSPEMPINLITKSKVQQTTGIDWNKVKISLSTGIPNSGRIAPIFTAWFLREKDAQQKRQDDFEMAQNSISYATIKESAKQEESMGDYVVYEENQLNRIFSIDIPYTVKSDGKEQVIELEKQIITGAEYQYYCAPKLDNETYLIAEISGWEKLNLMTGQANITYDGTYLGQTTIDAASTNKKITLTLGNDRRISVKREKMQDFSSVKFLSTDTKVILTYKITVRNNQNKDVTMILKDQYPISTNKNINVELLEQTTKPTTNRKDIGVITWEENLKAGETKEYFISYSAKYPKDMILNL
ncbi:MAG: DUF4139 domain-containing protein [Prevotellaceae bacterium]|jgi:uncharacterized protein (TIGR02231 family)|nr:DUF4139 domain-containing protein [Prevotellaceae bacterium]